MGTSFAEYIHRERSIGGIGNNNAKVRFASPVWAVAAGQSVVLYKDNLIIGGGIID
jgi:tRNA U34 2-thiouridine synthase MnmA/TrmU